MLRLFLISGLVWMLALSACNSRVQSHRIDGSRQLDLAIPDIYDTDGYLMGGDESPGKYTIDRDVVGINTAKRDEMPGLVTPDEDGYIEIPMSGDGVPAISNTGNELEAEIVLAMQRYFKREGQVDVTIDTVSKNPEVSQVYVIRSKDKKPTYVVVDTESERRVRLRFKLLKSGTDGRK